MLNVTEKNLLSRIRRSLAKDGDRLISPRFGSSFWHQYGPHYIVDQRNVMTAWCCDLEVLGRELGVLRASEEVASC